MAHGCHQLLLLLQLLALMHAALHVSSIHASMSLGLEYRSDCLVSYQRLCTENITNVLACN
jgi:hypothetical protein